MTQARPSPTPGFTNLVPLRVRFGPLLRWFFLGFFLFAEIYLATRLWNGWQIQAIGRLVAIQIFFAPRLLFAGLAFSTLATVLAERMVRWIARPLSTRWLKPTTGLPPESELPLHIRIGELMQLATPARRQIEHGWEPGWLIITSQRMFWLSGVWRTTAWELDRSSLQNPEKNRLSLAPAPRWLGGFVVGMPPRLIVHLSPTAYPEDEHQETIALTEPLTILEYLGPDSIDDPEQADFDSEPLLQTQPTTEPLPVVKPIPRSNRPSPLEVRGITLPPRRLASKKPQPSEEKPSIKPIGRVDPLEVRGVVLPPRRKNS
ncbi:MAG: hypothetical protein WCJ40_04770 [Planctomycetota bacterium]|nr:hypothetical protein [Planctomycetota bacterium]